MFNNIGGKIKTLAEVLCWVGIAASVIGGIVVMFVVNRSNDYLILPGVLILVFGSLLSWASSFFVYGFGELIEDIHAMRNGEKQQPLDKKEENATTTKVDCEKISEIENLRSKGLITEEEYQQAISKHQ